MVTRRIRTESAQRRAVEEPDAPRKALRRPLREEQGSISTRRVSKVRKAVVDEEGQQQALSPRRFAAGEEPAFVRVNAGRTYDLGNFCSLRLDVSVTLPCLPEEIEDTYEQASQFVQDKMTEEESHWLGRRAPNQQQARRR